jgi:ABC-type dipeptide/oligopeptide/nickel transport system ATPase component
MNSLNPVMKVKDQIGDAIVTHGGEIERDPHGSDPRIVG